MDFVITNLGFSSKIILKAKATCLSGYEIEHCNFISGFLLAPKEGHRLLKPGIHIHMQKSGADPDIMKGGLKALLNIL